MAALRMPVAASVMRVGFERSSRGILVFEGESAVRVHLCDRVWRYKEGPGSVVLAARRWRLECGIAINSAGPLRPGHMLVVAQTPYSRAWLQHAVFKKGLRKPVANRPVPVIPEFVKSEDPIEWLELHQDYDPWERNSKLVAGISQPGGLCRDDVRASAFGDLILGACPNFDEIINELWHSEGVQDLLAKTRERRIVFWFPNRAHVHQPPLYPEVVEASEELMGLSIQQALAGPGHSPEHWIGHPVWKMADRIYRGHLNDLSRVVRRRREREGGGTTGEGVGAGTLVDYVRSFSAKPIARYSCFISYSSKDLEFARRLHADLSFSGLKCWFAPEDLKIGELFHQRIEESIRLHDKLLLILSAASVRSSWVERELKAAMEREEREERLVLIPLQIDDAVMESDRAWAADIRRQRHIGDFRLWKDAGSYQRSLDRLLRDLKKADSPGRSLN